MPRNLVAHRVKATLSETIDHRVKLYSVAAAAAGVGILALAQPADAEVVITNKTIPIPLCQSFDTCPVLLDLNHDGIADFQFSLSGYPYREFNIAKLTVEGVAEGQVVGSQAGSHGPYASALIRGAKIGPSEHFITGAQGLDTIEDSFRFYSGVASMFSQNLFGKWGSNHPNRFLGVKFLIKGETHYGWVRLTVSTPRTSGVTSMSATITGYGYETIPNKRVLAGLKSTTSDDTQASQKDGRPGGPSLGVLALGADGLAMWRRDETLLH